MEKVYEVVYDDLVLKIDFERIATARLLRIKQSIETKLFWDPISFGKPLRFSLKGYRSLRVGKYRVIYKVRSKTVFVLAIAKRAEAYNVIEKRL